MIVLYNQAVAVCAYFLAEPQFDGAVFSLYSVYVQTFSLVVFSVLCQFRGSLNKLKSPVGEIACVAIVLLAFVLLELIAHWVSPNLVGWDQDRFLRLFFVVFVFALMMLRLIHLFDILEQRNQAEAQSRLHALQSRIRPHFLFNSLNTIAELTVSQPQEAEKAIGSLSSLFRANLETEAKFHSLKDEVRLCQRYLELERWRLGSRLSVRWKVNIDRPSAWQLPKLILQPLIENAVLHGVQADGSVELKIDLRETKQYISLLVNNQKGTVDSLNDGHGIAVDNIRERLFVLYDDKQSFRVQDRDGQYQVIMRLPKNRKHKPNRN